MQKLLLLGAAVLTVALGAAEANAIPILNKEASPYAVLDRQVQSPNGFAALIEGRSAYSALNGATPIATPRLQAKTHR